MLFYVNTVSCIVVPTSWLSAFPRWNGVDLLQPRLTRECMLCIQTFSIEFQLSKKVDRQLKERLLVEDKEGGYFRSWLRDQELVDIPCPADLISKSYEMVREEVLRMQMEQASILDSPPSRTDEEQSPTDIAQIGETTQGQTQDVPLPVQMYCQLGRRRDSMQRLRAIRTDLGRVIERCIEPGSDAPGILPTLAVALREIDTAKLMKGSSGP